MIRIAEDYRRILLLRAGAIGDVMHTLPTVKWLKELYPQAEIVFCSDLSLKELLKSAHYIDRVQPVKLSSNPVELFQQARQIKCSIKGRFDLILNLQPSWKSRFFCWFLGGSGYREYRKRADQTIPSWRNFSDTFRLGLTSDQVHSFLPLLMIADQNLQLPERPFVALALGVGKFRSQRAWSLEYWVDLVEKLQRDYRELRFALIGGKDEQNLSYKFKQMIGIELKDKVQDYTGIATLIETAYLLQNARLTISGDTGPLHLAGAVGCLSLGLFGPTSAQRHHPYGGEVIEAGMKCDPACTSRRCVLDASESCMSSLKPEVVIEKVSELLTVQKVIK
ncbi:MAG: glycosyltransferase family 9 protein [Candidatus Caenarcaniphilales bacterium]|nr:glycosyltransferase family 9 protein [Candidatus Caenarcaniphilales bacterium]